MYFVDYSSIRLMFPYCNIFPTLKSIVKFGIALSISAHITYMYIIHYLNCYDSTLIVYSCNDNVQTRHRNI